MSPPKFIDIEGKRFLWREFLQRRREQVAAARVGQPALFEMKEDYRPEPERTAAGAIASRACSARRDGRLDPGFQAPSR